MTNLFVFFIGTAIGSFLNVLIDRLPHNRGINGRSKCDFCHKIISWYDLFPIFSFIFLKGKCRNCHKKLSWQYPIIEALTGLIFLAIFNFQFTIFSEFSILNFQFSIFNLLIMWGLAATFIVIFVSDLKYHLISDYILLAFLVFSVLFHFTGGNLTFKSFGEYLFGGLVVGLPIFLIYFISKERAMGLGDVFITAIIGFLLGWKAGLLALYIAFVTGALIGLSLILIHKKRIKNKIPFGPFLVIGTVTMLYYQEAIFALINKLYGF